MNSIDQLEIYNSKDYERISNAIAFMRRNYRSQPDLAAIAGHVHLSEYHFQRLFTKWAGISPKRFQQYLTIEYAKSKIAHTKSLLDLTLETGLSSPGRLHDLFVTLEAMSPGEFKTGGAGLQIRYGIHDTPFGQSLIATTSRGICHLSFLDGMGEQDAVRVLQKTWANSEVLPDSKVSGQILDAIFKPTAIGKIKPLTLCVKGTNFQIQVWRALLNLPFGSLTTYQHLAEVLGRPTAARAVGNAVGRNPIAYLIPCHRVIRGSGELGGYRWGLDRKMSLLGWEASHADF